jgi:hypothetical protein
MGTGLSHLVIPFGKRKWRIRILYESYHEDDVVAVGKVLTAYTGWPIAVVEQHECD